MPGARTRSARPGGGCPGPSAAIGTVMPRAFATDRGGAIAFGLALVVPLLVLSCIVTVEVGRLVILQVKVARLASAVAEMGARTVGPDGSTAHDIVKAAEDMLDSFRLADGGVVVLRAIGAPGGGRPGVMWQRLAGAFSDQADAAAAFADAARLPEPLVGDGRGIFVVVEVIFPYEPWLLGVLAARPIVRNAHCRVDPDGVAPPHG